MTIRWKRGFFRAWVVFAVLWIAAAAWILTRPSEPTGDPFQDLRDDIPYRTQSGCEDAAKTNPHIVIENCVEEAYRKNWRDVGKLTWVFLPPVLILIFGSEARSLRGHYNYTANRVIFATLQIFCETALVQN